MAVAPTLTLIVDKGPRKGESIECKRGRVIRIGRVVRGNTFAIKEPAISERHISVQHLPDHSWSLTDLDTSNGTFLNERQIDPLVPASLRDGDLIKIGAKTSIRVQIVEEEEEKEKVEVAERRRRRGRPKKLAVAEETIVTKEASNVRRTRGVARREAAEALRVQALEGDKGGSGEEKEREVVTEKASKGGASTGRKGRGASRRRPPDLGSTEEELEEDGKSGEQSVRCVEQEKCSDDGGVAGEVRSGGLEECAFNKEVSSVGCVGFSRTADEHGGVVVAEEEEDEVEEEEIDGGVIVAEEEEVEEEEEIDMEKMTLGQWFDRLEKCLPMMISDAAEEIIAEIRVKADRYNDYLSGRCGAV